jgi:hypothetical protein
MPCNICGSPTQKPQSKSHIDTNLHQNALRKGNIASTNVRSQKQIPSENLNLSNLENRINQLTKQMNFVLSKIDDLENQIISKSSQDGYWDDNKKSSFKNQIIKLIPKDTSISVDELKSHFQNTNIRFFTSVLVELIDEEKIDGIEGTSQIKILHRYGRLTRR